MDYIDRQAAIDNVMCHYEVGNKSQNESMDWCAEMLQTIPSADVAPVRHGRWEDCSNGWSCSLCHQDCWKDYRYCPNCGARMDVEQDG